MKTEWSLIERENASVTDIVLEKKLNSEEKIADLMERLSRYRELTAIDGLTIYITGSYARLEASKHSDVDLFFVVDKSDEDENIPNLKKYRFYSRIIDIVDSMGFPSLSNDGEFLKLIRKGEMLDCLGGRNDDYDNMFTARMLLLLESRCLFNSDTYGNVISDVVDSYFRDYPHYPEKFRPTFLLNDIIRFWKTLCLNYEHKRNKPTDDLEKKAKQSIKNFKLKYSRLLTCFGTIAYICSMEDVLSPLLITEIIQKPPRDRLLGIKSANERIEEYKETLASEYNWFLKTTNVPEEELLQTFLDKSFKEDAFNRAQIFGDDMFNLVRELADDSGYTRYLVV